MLTFITIVIVSGMLGGFIYSLDTSDTHQLTFPWKGEAKDTGWLGHVLIGAGGAVIAIAAYVLLVKVDLGFIVELDNITPYKSGWKEETVKQALYFAAVGILGGYSGLRIISGTSGTLIKQLERELKSQGSRLDKQTQSTRKHVTELEFDTKVQQGILNIHGGNYEQSLSDLDIALKVYKQNTDIIHKNKIVALYSWRGNTLKRLGKITEALDSINTAIKLSEKPKPLHYFNRACYVWLSTKNAADTSDALNSAIVSVSSSPEAKQLEKMIMNDEDLDIFRKENHNEIQELLVSLKGKCDE